MLQESSVFIEFKCGCDKQQWYKVRFYSARLPTNIPFDSMPQYDGMSDLVVTNYSAHISSFVMSGNARFRRMHDVDFEKIIRSKFPLVKTVLWERHKGGECIKIMRNLD